MMILNKNEQYTEENVVSYYTNMTKSQPNWSRQVDFFLHNVWVLFAFVLLSGTTIIYLAVAQDILSILVLFLIGFLVYFFTSNMVIVLTLALVFTALFRCTHTNQSLQIVLGQNSNNLWYWEGMQNESDSDNDSDTDISGSSLIAVDNIQPAPTPSSLLEQTFPTSPPTDAELEKYRLQNNILEKIQSLQPLFSSIATMSKPLT